MPQRPGEVGHGALRLAVPHPVAASHVGVLVVRVPAAHVVKPPGQVIVLATHMGLPVVATHASVT